MCRKLSSLIFAVVVLATVNSASAGEYPGLHMELRVDMALNVDGQPWSPTCKACEAGYEDWICWHPWGDAFPHDAQNYMNIGGSPVHVGLGVGRGDSYTVFQVSSEEHDPICNTWLEAKESDAGSPGADIHIVLYGDPLPEGEYWVYGYHNTPEGNEPNIPLILAGGYCDMNSMQNIGATPGPNDHNCTGHVFQIHDEDTNDVNVPIQHVTFDANLGMSLVKLITDGTPVKIKYMADPNNQAILNAFVIFAPIPRSAWGPQPKNGIDFVCPDANLAWEPGVYVQDTNGHNVYFGTDLSEEITLLDDSFEAGDANWTPVNWTLYDSNVLGDGNSDGNSHSVYYSMTPGSGVGTLTSNTINTSEAGSLRVELWIRTLEGIEAGDIDLYYYDGNSWDFIADLNSLGPNNVWLHYTDEVTDSQYMVSTFKLELQSDISGGEVFVDDVSVTNTWPLNAQWFVGNQDPCTYSPPGLLELDTTYYWRVDEVNDSCDASPWQGRLWSFTTEDGSAREPSPGNGSGSAPLEGITLGWTPSCIANYHDVYFGTDFNDVNTASDPNSEPGQGRQTEMTYDTGPLVFNRQYFWRVDELGPKGLFKGEVWRFQTIGYPLMYYKFDGVLDSNIGDPWDPNFLTDDTGNITFINLTVAGAGGFEVIGAGGSLTYAESNPLYNPGGTSAHFVPDEGGACLVRSVLGGDVLDLAGLAYTIEMWVKQESDWDDNVEEEEFAATLFRKYDLSYVVAIGDDGAVRFVHAGYDEEEGGITLESSADRIGLGEWHHIAAVFDACDADPDGKQRLYIDGLQVADGNSKTQNPGDDDDPVTIGARINPVRVDYRRVRNIFHGYIDELRVVDLALEPLDFLICGDPNLPCMPRPYNYATEVEYNVDLEWSPGRYASSHDVFLGTDWDDINDVNSSNYASYPNVDYNHVEVCSHDPCLLELGQMYYWRVDEVNDACDPNGWRGNIWRFKVADYVVIDDFEDYENSEDLWGSWIDGAWNSTGAFIALQSTSPISTGDNSMQYLYYTSADFGSGSYYAQIEIKNLDPNNWDVFDPRILLLWFHGKTGNDADVTEQMYVALEDNDGNYAEARYPLADMDDIRDEEWYEWKIFLSDFTNVNRAKLETLFIGFGDRDNTTTAGGTGTVHFDDIRVYPPYCVPEEGPEADLSGNCIVDFADIEIMADEWLVADVNLGEVVKPDANGLVGWWEFDEGSGSTASDSSSYNHHGTLEINDVNVSWVAGYDGNALEFDGGRVRVPDACELKPMHQVSACAWIYYSDEQDAARIVVKGADNKETYALEVSDNDELLFYVGDNNDYDPCDDEYERYFAESNEVENPLERDEWIHIAGTFDGNTVKCYINGEVADTNDDPNAWGITLCQDNNDLAIGNREDDDERPFEGTIDDVRVYDYALSAEEVAYIATDGTGIFALESIADIYKEPLGKGAVNLKDFAELAKDWLKKELWPP